MSDQQFHQAPLLPRLPTELDVPSTLSPPAPAHPLDQPTLPNTGLPPPPKFPSLSDVSLPNARAAAAHLPTARTVPELIPTNPTSHPATTTTAAAATATAAAAAAAATADLADPAAGHHLHGDDDELDEDPTELDHDIEAAILRDEVPPGTGARRALEVGETLWTDTDQEELNRLLEEGEQVVVPPHLVAASAARSHLPINPLDLSPDKRPMADKIAVWDDPSNPNRHEREEDRDHSAARSASVDASAALPPLAPFHGDQDPHVGHTESASGPAPPPARADVARTIFGGHFLCKPVTSRNMSTDPVLNAAVDADRTPPAEEVLLRIDSTAKVDVTEDYGLHGGHDSVVNDAVFMDGDSTLVTCGADGKVCVWDMADRTVKREFIPYDDAESVTMIYPLPADPSETSHTLMTLSESRIMRIWVVDDRQAVMLRTSQIKATEGDLYMSIPAISSELRTRAVAAAAAAAITTSDAPEEQVAAGTAIDPVPVETEAVSDTVAATASVPDVVVTESVPKGAADNVEMDKEEERDRKRFSLTKVLSFGRTSAKKAVAS